MSEYKRTLMDRLGPDVGAIIRAVAYGWPGGLVVAIALAAKGPGDGLWRLLFALLGFVGGWALASLATYYVAHGSGKAVLSFVAPSGATTPYQRTFSQQEALAVAGRVDEALASYEDLVAADAADAEVRIAAAELYARTRRDPRRAEALYREARRVPGLPPVRDLWITNRLVDLYRGQLADDGRALVELRRIAERFPMSREAGFAREAIARLKESR
jgi:hypothetical protein